MRRHWLLKVAAFLVCAPLLLAAVSFVVMLLWNALIPSLFSGPVLGFWQAAGLFVLCRILFVGIRGHGHRGWGRRAWRQRWHSMTPEERDRFRDGMQRWRQMSPEERREFRRGFRGCGGGMMGESSEPRDTTHAQRQI